MNAETLLKASKKLLEDDNIDPDASTNQFSIHHYVADRIYTSFSPVSQISLLQLTLWVDYNGGIGDLPTDEYALTITAWAKREQSHAQLKIIRLVQRVKELFKNKHDDLNSQGFDLKCRLIDFISAIPIIEDIKTDKIYHIPARFRVILGN